MLTSVLSAYISRPSLRALVTAETPVKQKLPQLGRRESFAVAMGKTRKAFYAVRVGRNVGVYNSWAECEAQVKCYSGAVYKGFSDRAEAHSFAHAGPSRSTKERYRRDFPSSRPRHSVQTAGQKCDHRTGWGGASYACDGNPGSSGSGSTRGAPVVYSDGCCFNNGRSNAQAGVGVYWGHGHRHNVSERLSGHQTNQRAEVVDYLRAVEKSQERAFSIAEMKFWSACRAVETALEQGLAAVEVKTDSSYTIKAMTEWVGHWKRNGWQTVQKEDVKNKEDLLRLDQLCQRINVKWIHVPGHKGIHGNEEADKLAKAGSQQ